MKTPLATGPWVEVPKTLSTQDDMRQALLRADTPAPGVIFAAHQSAGRGRFDRPWFSEGGKSLTMSMAFQAYADHPRPWLLGMALAAAAAGCLHCRLQWPNDLFLDGKKIGGVLTEILSDHAGRSIPVVGIGVNLDILDFPPELAGTATSLAIHRPGHHEPQAVGQAILARLADLPEPEHWSDLQPVWSIFDDTPGKKYKLISGETAIAIGIGPEGELVCAVEGETTMVMAAEAILG
jgi:BirA family biotin operon repressor/biotin-[acetyl-CoA-carboxylase] ligase